MRHLFQRAALVGFGGYVASFLLIGYEAVAHPEYFVHVTLPGSLGLNVILGAGIFLVIAAGAALALAISRSRPSDIPLVWFFGCGVLVYLLARILPTFSLILESCPAGQVCNSHDWGLTLDPLRYLLIAFVATAVLARLPRAAKTSQ